MQRQIRIVSPARTDSVYEVQKAQCERKFGVDSLWM